jgi:glycerol-3-phosphate acyltransferase PlsY
MDTIFPIVTIILSYFIGAVPFGLIFSRVFSKVDVRNVGSGNIGATNVLRASGKTAALLTLVADALKGYLPVLIAKILFQNDTATVLTGMASILGHNFPIYLRFKGGKGVATSYGVALAASPLIGLIILLIWPLAAYLWRYSSLSALISLAFYPVLTFAVPLPVSKAYQLLSLFVFALIYYRHRENIRRLIAGTEPKIGEK